MAKRSVLRVTLEYPDIDSLFKQPDVSPFSEDFHDYSTRPGIEHIYNEMHSTPSLRRVEATIVLPPEKITPGLEQRARDAVRRYCLARAKEMSKDERALRWRALRALAFAILLFVAYAIVQDPLQKSGIALFNLVGEGLDILVWVAFWFPLDALVFGVMSYDTDSKSYRRVSRMQLKIKPAPTRQPPGEVEAARSSVNPSREGGRR